MSAIGVLVRFIVRENLAAYDPIIEIISLSTQERIVLNNNGPNDFRFSPIGANGTRLFQVRYGDSNPGRPGPAFIVFSERNSRSYASVGKLVPSIIPFTIGYSTFTGNTNGEGFLYYVGLEEPNIQASLRFSFLCRVNPLPVLVLYRKSGGVYQSGLLANNSITATDKSPLLPIRVEEARDIIFSGGKIGVAVPGNYTLYLDGTSVTEQFILQSNTNIPNSPGARLSYYVPTTGMRTLLYELPTSTTGGGTTTTTAGNATVDNTTTINTLRFYVVAQGPYELRLSDDGIQSLELAKRAAAEAAKALNDAKEILGLIESGLKSAKLATGIITDIAKLAI